MTSSTIATRDCYELWIFAPNDWRAPVEECGVYESRGVGASVAQRLAAWLTAGVFHDNLLDGCRDGDDRTAVLTMREFLHEQGVDPTVVTVGVVKRGEVPDSRVTVPAVRCDAGHAPRGPFASVDVRALRN